MYHGQVHLHAHQKQFECRKKTTQTSSRRRLAHMGGNIRGATDYKGGGFFSMEGLEAEVKSDEVVAIVQMPGWLLAEGIQATHLGVPIPGWMQYDMGVIEDTSVHPPVVTHVNGQPLNKDQIYRVATKIADLTNGQSPPLKQYYQTHPEALPPKGAYVNIQAELMVYFARSLWRKLWQAVAEEVSQQKDMDENNAADYLEVLDRSGDGTVTVEEIQISLKNMLGISIDKREKTFAEFIHGYADTTGNGKITITDIRHFMEELNEDGPTTTTSDATTKNDNAATTKTKIRIVAPESDSDDSDVGDDDNSSYAAYEAHNIDNLMEEAEPHQFTYE
jgi:hypothetical protein